MKNFHLLIAFTVFLSLAGCSNDGEKTRQNDTTIPKLDTAALPSKDNLLELGELNGSYPMEVDLLDNPLINNRLKDLLGGHYADFRKYWNVETPIIVENNILSTTGCEQHNCGANQYIMQIDLLQDNINIYHIGTEIKSYQEKGPIDLPSGLAKDFEIMKSNMVN